MSEKDQFVFFYYARQVLAHRVANNRQPETFLAGVAVITGKMAMRTCEENSRYYTFRHHGRTPQLDRSSRLIQVQDVASLSKSRSESYHPHTVRTRCTAHKIYSGIERRDVMAKNGHERKDRCENFHSGTCLPVSVSCGVVRSGRRRRDQRAAPTTRLPCSAGWLAGWLISRERKILFG